MKLENPWLKIPACVAQSKFNWELHKFSTTQFWIPKQWHRSHVTQKTKSKVWQRILDKRQFKNSVSHVKHFLMCTAGQWSSALQQQSIDCNSIFVPFVWFSKQVCNSREWSGCVTWKFKLVTCQCFLDDNQSQNQSRIWSVVSIGNIFWGELLALQWLQVLWKLHWSLENVFEKALFTEPKLCECMSSARTKLVQDLHKSISCVPSPVFTESVNEPNWLLPERNIELFLACGQTWHSYSVNSSISFDFKLPFWDNLQFCPTSMQLPLKIGTWQVCWWAVSSSGWHLSECTHEHWMVCGRLLGIHLKVNVLCIFEHCAKAIQLHDLQSQSKIHSWKL